MLFPLPNFCIKYLFLYHEDPRQPIFDVKPLYVVSDRYQGTLETVLSVESYVKRRLFPNLRIISM